MLIPFQLHDHTIEKFKKKKALYWDSLIGHPEKISPLTANKKAFISGDINASLEERMIFGV